jgi:hypothetical protein
VRFYFDSKAAMLVASLEYLAAEFEERVLAPVARLKDTPVQALRAAGGAVSGPRHRQSAQGLGLVLVLGRGQLAPGVSRYLRRQG